MRWTHEGYIGPPTYDAAKHNLERCHYVGITERLTDFMADVCQGLGWQLPVIPRRNVTRYEAHCTPEVEAIVRDKCAFDYLLYEQAKAYAIQHLPQC